MKVTTQDEKNAVLNLLFSTAVKNLKIPEFSDTNPLAERDFLIQHWQQY